jgi:twinkle protein
MGYLNLMRERNNLPCWDKEDCGGKTSCTFYVTPKPHLHCHKCSKQNWNLSDEEIEIYQNMEANLLKLYNADTPTKGNTIISDKTNLFPQKGMFSPIEQRSLKRETCEKYNVETIFSEGGLTVNGYLFPVIQEGNLLAQKMKRPDKKMTWLYPDASMPKGIPLFGQNLFPSGGKFLTITEGEEDAMAVYQMLKEDNPAFEPAVVSIFNGSGGAEKECKVNWEYINSFENIIIAFDGDEEGRKAAEKVCRLFQYKPKVINFMDSRKTENPDGTSTWKLKDGNDYLKEGKAKDFIRMWWKAERITPKGVVTFKALWDSMMKTETNVCVPYPWPGLNEKLHAMTTGHFIVIKAPPKVGKTSILKELIYHITSTTLHNVGIIFLENTKKEIGVGLCALHLNKVIKPWDIPSNIDELTQAHEELSKDERIIVFDPEDDRTVDNVINKIIYFVKAHDCRFIFLDHITMLSYQSGDENERKFLDKLCADLKELTTSQDVCLIAVTHVNDDGKTRGSRASVQLCEAMISLERDKTDPDPVIANTTRVIVEENRWGDCGLACSLFYDPDTGRMMQLDEEQTIDIGGGKTVQFDA